MDSKTNLWIVFDMIKLVLTFGTEIAVHEAVKKSNKNNF